MTIKTMQARLNEAGFSCGAVDGVFGKGTLSALMAYLARRQADDAIRERAKALLAFWRPQAANEPNGWSPLRLIHFLAQVCHETQGWQKFEENLHYTTPARLNAVFKNVTSDAHAAALIARGPQAIANCVYANRNGNGNEASGDGWRYRGAGDIMITGMDNYRIYGNAIALNLVQHPEIIKDADVSIRVALAYWRLNGCNAWADKGNTARITLLVNGEAMEGLEQRKANVARGREVWEV